MKKLGLIFILFVIIPAAWAGEYALPKNLSIALPKDGSVKLDWVAPPLLEKQVQKADLRQPVFHLDSRGAVWVCYNQQSLTDFSSGFSLGLKQTIQDFVFLKNNALFLLTENSLGTAVPWDKAEAVAGQISEVLFQPICGLPLTASGLFANDQEQLFIYGFDPKTRESAVYELLSDFSSWRKIFVSSERILAAAAGQDMVYIASGRMVFQVPLKPEQKEKIIFSHPLDVITSLSFIQDSGIFYTTASAVGLVNEQGSLEFIKTERPQTAVWQNQLYVFLPNSLGVLRLADTKYLFSK